VIVQYLADRKPEAQLAPPAGSMERYRLQEWLNYIASEVHKSFSPLFRASEEQRPALRDALAPKLEFLARHLEKRQFLLGDRFSVADAYLFTVLNWSKFVGIDLGRWPALDAYLKRIAARPAVRAALEAEGLLRS
jgi:glutathione S-transferase